MAWVAKRKTTKEEDLAYCLFGIFDVNMPLLYGEGLTKAFVRLQLEFIRKSDDETIFAWNFEQPFPKSVEWMGLLAPSPALFAPSPAMKNCRLIKTRYVDGRHQYRHPYNMTNQGLEFTFDTRDVVIRENGFHGSFVLLPLNCELQKRIQQEQEQLAILLQAQVALKGEVLLAWRYGPWLSGNIHDPPSFKPHTIRTAGNATHMLPHECAIVVSEGAAKRLKVYVRQSGL